VSLLNIPSPPRHILLLSFTVGCCLLAPVPPPIAPSNWHSDEIISCCGSTLSMYWPCSKNCHCLTCFSCLIDQHHCPPPAHTSAPPSLLAAVVSSSSPYSLPTLPLFCHLLPWFCNEPASCSHSPSLSIPELLPIINAPHTLQDLFIMPPAKPSPWQPLTPHGTTRLLQDGSRSAAPK